MASTNTVQMSRRLRRAARENDAPIWARMAELALKPASARRTLNVKKIASLTKPSDAVAVPGKVLSVGIIGHPITLAAFSISRQAASKIRGAGGSIVTLEKLSEMHPAGTGVVLLG